MRLLAPRLKYLGKIIDDNSKWKDKFIETLEKELGLNFQI